MTQGVRVEAAVRNYLIRRVLLLVPTVLVVCIIVFSLIEFIPGDVVLARLTQIGNATPETIDALRADLGIDRPFLVRLGEWIGDLFQGDLGRSLWTLEPATKQLWSAIPVSLELVLGGMLIGVLAGVPLGVISAMKQDKPVDTGARFLSVIGLAVPDFWIATMVILYASLWFNYSSPVGYTPFVDDPLRNLEQFSIPMAILGIRLVAATARMTRSTLLEVMREDYVRTARSKGLSERVVLYRHALRNAVLPVITLVGTNLGFLLGGAVVLESIYSLPGLGNLVFTSILRRDYIQLQAAVLFLALALVVMNLIVDLCYSWLDPRVRYE